MNHNHNLAACMHLFLSVRPLHIGPMSLGSITQFRFTSSSISSISISWRIESEGGDDDEMLETMAAHESIDSLS